MISTESLPTIHVYEGPRTRVGQPKMKYWKLHRNEVLYEHMPKYLEIFNLSSSYFKSISKFWGVNSILWG